MKKIALIGLLIAGLHSAVAAEKMTNEGLLKVINEVAESVEQSGNTVQFAYQGLTLILIYDSNADRMRLVSPIIEAKDLQAGMLEKAMEANFHSALDARYATSDGIVWSVFIHPLSDLTPSFFKSAIRQVAIARATFGDQYTSGADILQCSLRTCHCAR